MIRVLILFLFIPYFVQAHWEVLLRAQSSEQLMAAELEIIKGQQRKEACELEKSRQWFPFSCLQIFGENLEKVEALEGLQREYEALEKLCVSAQDYNKALFELKNWLSKDWLPSHCRHRLEQKYKDLLYIEGLKVGPDLELFSTDGEVTGRKSLL